MARREPYQIKGIMLAYNLFQTVFSTWMFLEGWGFYVSGNYSWQCEPVDYSNSPTAMRALNLAWWYFFSKFIDLFDSFFFVARDPPQHPAVAVLVGSQVCRRGTEWLWAFP